MEKDIIRRLTVGERTFEFLLCRQPNDEMGPIVVDRWWMEITPLYGYRRGNNSPAQNHEQIVAYYWALCQRERATRVRYAQERFLLSVILPHVRIEGSRNIFADAFLRPRPGPQQRALVAELDALLQEPQKTPKRVTFVKFHKLTVGLLGPAAEYPPEVFRLRHAFLEHLFNDACGFLRVGRIQAARYVVRERWTWLMQRYGRRSNCPHEKTALDVISYEARSAFHDLYSTVWTQLLPTLVADYQLSPVAANFLSFWHQDRKDFAPSLFHGHVFGLHPALGPFLQTTTGRELLGTALHRGDYGEDFERLLFGITVALSFYRTKREEAAQARRIDPERNNQEDLPERENTDEFDERRHFDDLDEQEHFENRNDRRGHR